MWRCYCVDSAKNLTRKMKNQQVSHLITKNHPLNEAIIEWGYQTLLSHGYRLSNYLPEKVKDTPWSYVARYTTTDGYIYLKHTPPLLALEAAITQILHDSFCAAVPQVIAHHTELDCFLMKDAGRPLRDMLKKQFDAALLSQAINQFSTLQLTVADHIELFLDVGVPDWRLEQLPALYQQLLSQKDVLLADGLSEKDINALKASLPKFTDLCEKLSTYAIQPSIAQSDFHDNNILINEGTQQITFIDLGEIVISHPFFSLISCLRQVLFHHGLTDEDDTYRSLMNACLKNYWVLQCQDHLLEAFAIARVLWFVYEGLAQYRLRLACDEEKFIAVQRHGKLRDVLKDFMAACMAFD